VEKLPSFKNSPYIAKKPEQMRKYLKDYVTEHKLDENFVYDTEVYQSFFVGDGYVTQTNRGNYKSKYLVLGVGINAKDGDGSKYIPDFKDRESFKGELVHAYTLSEDYRVNGKNVIVIGNGPTSI
jgi:cation diffusion facilitator CzcD-associated flavoprotein CzcO